MASAPAVLSVADLADGGADLVLDSLGRPEAPLAVVDLDHVPDDATVARATTAAARSHRVLVGRSTGTAPAALLDALACTIAPRQHGGGVACVEVDDIDAGLADLARSVAARPQAAGVLVPLLRLTSRLPASDGLVAESLAYSMLLAGPEFTAWRASRPQRAVPPPSTPPVLVQHDGDQLLVTLNRPERRNAYGRRVRDALVEALTVAEVSPSVQVLLRGAGADFCSGGDLDEFGTAPDVVTAHTVRVEHSAASLLDRCRERVRVEVHGACIGAGVELPSFAHCVVARENAWFQLPELRMGLVPGAGGTVSVVRRIGRWRTAWMALSGNVVDLSTALTWGLVDGRAA